MCSSSQQGNAKLALGLSKLYEREFNQPDLHDKVLVFDVVASNKHDLSKENVRENKSNMNEIIENEEGENQWERASRNGKVNNEGINTDDENETKVYNCEMSSKYANGGQRVEKRLNNLGEDEHVGTETNAIKDTLIDEDKMKCVEVNEAEETAAASKHEITVNENVRVSPHANNRNKLKDQPESEISNDDNDPNLHLSDGETSEKLLNHSGVSSGKNYKVTSFNTSEGQIIEQHKFYVHSSWLALQSSYFRSLFFPERNTHRCTEVHVKIPRNEEKAHFMLLEAMYKIRSLDNASVDDLLKVLRLAHEYNVEFVLQKCVYSLQSAVVSLEICKKIMCFIEVENAITYADDLVITLQSFLEKEFSPLDETWPTKSFEDLSETLLRYLLNSDKLVVISENTVFHALMHWIEKRGIEKLSESRELPSLLSVVRFEMMTVDYLYDIVQHNPIAKTLPDFHELYLRGISYHALSGTTRQRSLPQPVTRRENSWSSIVYTWNIPGDQLDLLVGNNKSFKSDEFWVCGYKMVLVIEDVSQVENHKMFHAKLSLEVLNLTDQSEMTIKWKPTCKTSYISTSFWEIFTFNKESRVSSVNMSYITATTLPPLSSPTKNVFTGAASITSRPPPQSRDGINLGIPTTNVPTGTTSTTKPLFVLSTDAAFTSQSRNGVNPTFPTTNVSNGAASTTKPLHVFPADTSQSRSGMNPTFPTTNVSTRAASTTKPLRAFSTATRSLLSRSRSESNPTFPTANVSTGAASITKPAFVFSTTTPPSQSRSQTYHNLPTANVPTGAASATKTSLLFSTATLPSQSRSETYPNLPTANVPTCAASTTKPAFVFSTATLPSQSRSQSNPTFPMTNVSTGAASTTKSSFLFSTSTPFSQSRSETNPNPNLPTANVSTCAASTTKPSFGLSTATLTSQSRNGVNPTFPTTNVSTGAASTTKPSAFGLSTATLPSQSRNGVNPTFPTTNVSTCAAATTKPSFVFSTATLTSQSRNGVNPTFLTTNVSTGAASTTKPSFGLSTATIPSQSRSEVNPAFPTINVSTGAASITKPSFVLSTATISSRSRSGINPTFLTTNVSTGATTSKTPVFAFSADTFSSQSRGGMNYGLPTTNVSTIASASSNQNANPSSSVSKPASGEIGKVLTGISFSIYAKVK